MPFGRLVSPGDMIPPLDSADFYHFTAEEGEFYIQKEFIVSVREQEFLLTHKGRYKITKTRDALIIRSKER